MNTQARWREILACVTIEWNSTAEQGGERNKA